MLLDRVSYLLVFCDVIRGYKKFEGWYEIGDN